MREQHIAIIVDAYSTGKDLAPEFKKHGLECIHIRSSSNLPSKYAHKKEHFVESLSYEGNFQDPNKLTVLIEELKNLEAKNHYQFILCVPGSESGVELADSLSEKLNLTTNGTSLSRARRDKYEMTETVQKAGIQTAKHCKSDNSYDIAAWVIREAGSYPIVLKPLESASNDHIFFCNNLEEITSARDEILKTPNLFGKPNKEVLAQSFIYGQEYIVNTVSWEGRHYLAEIWRITKKPGTITYDRAEIVHDDETALDVLFKNTKKVLDILGIRFGPGTTEWKYTPDGGPVLLESAARLMGDASVSFSEEMIGFSQLSLTVEAYLTPDSFLKRLSQETRPEMQNENGQRKHGMSVILISNSKGILKKNIKVSEFNIIKTMFSQPKIGVQKGDVLHETKDYLTAVGQIDLISTDQNQLFKDYSRIRKIEKNLYREAIEDTQPIPIPQFKP